MINGKLMFTITPGFLSMYAKQGRFSTLTLLKRVPYNERSERSHYLAMESALRFLIAVAVRSVAERLLHPSPWAGDESKLVKICDFL